MTIAAADIVRNHRAGEPSKHRNEFGCPDTGSGRRHRHEDH